MVSPPGIRWEGAQLLFLLLLIKFICLFYMGTTISPPLLPCLPSTSPLPPFLCFCSERDRPPLGVGCQQSILALFFNQVILGNYIHLWSRPVIKIDH